MTLVRGDWFYILLVLIDSFFMTRPYLYVIQQDNYRISEIFKSRHLRFVYFIDFCAVVVFVGIWLLLYFVQAKAFLGFVTVLFFFIAEFAMYFMEDLPDRKKPLRYTKRAVRCLVFVTLVATAAVSVSMAVANAHLSNTYLRYPVFFAFPLVYPLIFILSASVINVFERLNNVRYERRTSKILLSHKDLIKIAITGSYAKTSVKNFLHTILSQKYNVLTTPASFNTPMGISKTVNGLDESYDVFIAEFGARRKGDIKKLMKIVKPDFTILTAINSQHLQTFKNEENIKKEKCRILEVDDGACVVNYNLKSVVETICIKKRVMPEIIFAGLDARADVYADDVCATDCGSEFDIVVGEDRYRASTRIIGMHNIENIILAVAMAVKLGVEIPYILNGIEQLEPVPHRMQLIQGNGIVIIDDSFNSNPDGAKCALDTLAMFDRRKVVMTPGLVELGEKEYEENRLLGERISSVADVVMLIGKKRTEAIKKGLQENGFGGEIFLFDTLKDAENAFSQILRLNDAFLILNDLPEFYDDMI